MKHWPVLLLILTILSRDNNIRANYNCSVEYKVGQTRHFCWAKISLYKKTIYFEDRLDGVVQPLIIRLGDEEEPFWKVGRVEDGKFKEIGF